MAGLRWTRVPGACALALWLAQAAAGPPPATPAAPAAATPAASAAGEAGAADGALLGAAKLREREAALAARLKDSPFREPLLLESREHAGLARGEVYAALPHPFARVATALQQPGQWCEALILHLNVKHCEAQPGEVSLHIGSKRPQPLDASMRLRLDYALTAARPDFLQVRMQADHGPLGTRNVAFSLEALPSSTGATFVHFEYQVGYGTIANLAMETYLHTLGSDKVGFSWVDTPQGRRLVGGTRGAVERNAMRYHLAIVAYLDSLAVPEATRLERRLAAWFDATERHATQLHEITREEYLDMKRRETAH